MEKLIIYREIGDLAARELYTALKLNFKSSGLK